MRAQDVVRLTALAAIWGGSFIFLRVLSPVLGPVLTATSRVLIAGVALIAYFRIAGVAADLRTQGRHYVVIGLVNSAVPFLLFAFAALHLPASYSVIMNASTPLFAALLSALFLAERLSPAKIGGLVSGAAGVALVSRAGPVEADAMFFVSIAAALTFMPAPGCSTLEMMRPTASAIVVNTSK